MDGKILIMDPSSYERQKVKHILEKIGDFQIIEISNFNQFKLFDLEAYKLQLIIIDIAFPTEAEGFEVMKILRSNTLSHNTPVITVTRSDIPENKARALKYSVNDFIIKPYQVKRLEDSIRSLITLNNNFHYDTGSLGNITMSFDDYISREMKYSKRTESPLSFIFITTLKIKKNKDGIEQIEIRNKETIFAIAAEKARESLRITDTIVMGKERDILIILPGTSEKGAEQVCEKIKSQIINELETMDIDSSDYIYPVHFTFPIDGEDFQLLMENAFKKASDKEMLEKIVLIPENTRKFADKSYNRYRKWF